MMLSVFAASRPPTPQEVRRAIARPRRGATLDLAEPTVLLAAMAGSEHGTTKTVVDFSETAAGIDRLVRERTTTYAVPGGGASEGAR
jgi:hypothetical protein